MAPATQADLDRIVESRLARERAKYEGFDELKAKAAKLDELEQANLTELQKATARAEKAETAGITVTIAAVLSLAASVGNANFVAGTKPLNAN